VKLIHCPLRPPPQAKWRHDIECRERSADEILDWCRKSLNGTVYWQVTAFAPPSRRRHHRNVRQKRFVDDVQVLTVWFHAASDAVLFKMVWVRTNEA
jgi:hypothetical protein